MFEFLLGTAFGICTAVQNLGLTIVPSIVAYTIKDSADAIDKLCCPPLLLHATALPFVE